MSLQTRVMGFQESFKKPFFVYGLLIFVTLVAAGLRFYKLGEWSFWIDEIATINRSLDHFNIDSIRRQWFNPSISVLLTGAVLNILEINEWNARLTSAIIGIALIPVLYFTVSELFDRFVGLIAAFLLAISSWHIFWSQNARFYTSLVLFYFLASVAFFFFIERGHLKYLFIFGIFIFLAFGERYIAILIGPSLLTYLLILQVLPYEKPEGFRLRTITVLLLAGLAFASLEVYSLLFTGTTRFFDTLSTFIGRPIDSPFRILILIFFSIGTALVGAGLYSAFLVLKLKNRAGLYFLVHAMVPIIITVVVSKFTFVVERYTLITLPFWTVLAAYGICVISKQTSMKGLLPGLAIFLVLVTDAFGNNLAYYQLNSGNRPEWRQAFDFVMERVEEGDVIVSSVSEVGSYYTKRDVQPLNEFDPEEITLTGGRYWFVLDSENSWWAEKQKTWVEENADLIEIFYLRIRERIFLKIYYYNQHYQNPAW